MFHLVQWCIQWQARSILKVFRNIHSDFHSDALELDDILLGERDDEDDPLNCPAGLSCRRTPYSLPLILHHGRLVSFVHSHAMLSSVANTNSTSVLLFACIDAHIM